MGRSRVHAAALKYPTDCLPSRLAGPSGGGLSRNAVRLRYGPLGALRETPRNPEIHYPDLGRAAVFACADGACSSRVFQTKDIEPAVRKALNR